MSYKKFTKDIGILGLTQVITAISGVITLPVITKLLGAENYGVWTQVMVTVGLMSPFILIGLPYTLVRFLAGEKDRKKIQDGIWSVFAIVFGISIIVSLFLISFSVPISRFLNCSKIFVEILPFIIMLSCFNSLFSNVFRAFQQIKEYCFFVIFENIGETALIILAIFLGYKLLGVILSVLIIYLITVLIMGALIIKRIGIKIPQFLKIREYLSFSLPTIFGDICFWIIQSSDKYFVGFFLGTLFVGYYAPACMLGGIISFFITPLSFILPATLSKHHDENKIDEVKTYLKYSLKYFLAFAIPAFFGLSVLSRQLLMIISTNEIAQHSYYITPFIALSMLLLGIYMIVAQIIALKKKTYIDGAIWLIAAFLNFGLNFIFVPRFGILGAGITTLLAYVFAFAAMCYYSFKELLFEIDWQFILKSIFASALMTIVIFELNPLGLWKTLAAILIGAASYFFLIFLFRGFGKAELNFLRKLPAKGN